MNDDKKSYVQAVTRKLEKRGLADEKIELEVKKIMGETLEVSLETIITNDGNKLTIERGTWCDTCDSKGRVHKLSCPKREQK